MARGREEARIVRAYLEAIDVPKRRGRQRSAESIARQLSQIEERLRTARGIDKLELLKQHRDLEAERAARSPAAAVASLERDFARVARSYGARKGIDYSLWRSAGVPAAVLSKARIQRTRRPNRTGPAASR
jgi:vacuolar-type H+-ATPase subunit I/STV1